MKAFHRLMIAVVIGLAGIWIAANLALQKTEDTGRLYLVEVERAAQRIAEREWNSSYLEACEYLTDVQAYGDNFYEAESDYVIREINGELYRFDYEVNPEEGFRDAVLVVNLTLAGVAVLVILTLFYVRIRVIKPFETLSDVPYELAKGNLTIRLTEQKSRFFGKFVWGMDMLREHLEQQKKRELELQREKKTLLLSLSHDIKTPLSAIKLYAKAISKGLYPDRQKQIEAIESIHAKADEIGQYVSQITNASKEDFIQLDVTIGEFYLSRLVKEIQEYYTEKLSLEKTEFQVEVYGDCLLKGDPDRSVEVLQNILENAIKYGDGAEISIGFGEEDGCILLTVRNTGCTLSDTDLPHIFASFWRGANAEKVSGSGLGLYICRKLMHKMNGEVFAEIKDGAMYVTVVFCKA